MFEIFFTIFNVLIYEPILNFLIFLYNILGNFGLAVIALTLIIKLVLNPLNQKSIESQKMMAEMQPKIKEIQKKYKDNKEEQGRELLKLYQEAKFNPFAGMFVVFLQLPILWALFKIFKSNIELDKLGSILYPFVSIPDVINYSFLGINLSEASIGVALITAVAQYFQAKTMQLPKKQDSKEKDQMEQISEMMQKQMMLIIPVFTFFILFKLPAALGLYWSLTTILNIFQQRKIFNKK